jgi:hypothetical protein
MNAFSKVSFSENSNPAPLRNLLPLVILLFLTTAYAYMLPSLSNRAALTFAGGIIIFIVCLVSTDAALYILIFSMLLGPEFAVGPRGHGPLGRGITLRMSDLMLLVIGFSWLAKMAINKQFGLFRKTPLNQPIAYYTIICLASTLIGALFGRVNLKTGFFFVLKYFEYTFVFFMVANHLHDREQLKKYLGVMLLTCAICSFIGILQISEGIRLSLPFEGERGEPNTFGGYLTFIICITAGLLLNTNSFRCRILCGILICLFITPLFYTLSRSSYIALTLGVCSFVWLSEKRRWVLATLIILGISLVIFAPERVKDRVAYTFTQGKDRDDVEEVMGVKLDTSTSERLSSWKNVTRDWVQHPLMGFGVTGYGFLDGQYFRVLIETGLLGLFTFIFLLFRIFHQVHLVFSTTTDPFDRGLCMGFLAGFISLLFQAIGANTFTIVRIMESFWFAAGMVIRLPNLSTASPVENLRSFPG